MSDEAARCAVHAESAAVFTCARCGCFACPACKTELDGVCLACFARPEQRLGASRRAKLCLGLSVAALHGLFPLAFVALWLSEQERQAIAAHASPRGGEPWLQGTKWLSFAALAGWALFWGARLLSWLDA